MIMIFSLSFWSTTTWGSYMNHSICRIISINHGDLFPINGPSVFNDTPNRCLMVEGGCSPNEWRRFPIAYMIFTYHLYTYHIILHASLYTYHYICITSYYTHHIIYIKKYHFSIINSSTMAVHPWLNHSPATWQSKGLARPWHSMGHSEVTYTYTYRYMYTYIYIYTHMYVHILT